MAQAPALYDTDFFAWTEQQSHALRRLAERRVNLDQDLDLTNLLEEVESMGRSDPRTVRTALARIIEHLLKLEYSTNAAPRRSWRESVGNHRIMVAEQYADRPSLRERTDAAAVWQLGRKFAINGLRPYEPEAVALLPAACPYSLDQGLDDDWLPANRHGLA